VQDADGHWAKKSLLRNLAYLQPRSLATAATAAARGETHPKMGLFSVMKQVNSPGPGIVSHAVAPFILFSTGISQYMGRRDLPESNPRLLTERLTERMSKQMTPGDGL